MRILHGIKENLIICVMCHLFASKKEKSIKIISASINHISSYPRPTGKEGKGTPLQNWN
uniref:Uncharacterized protein n=1 Tax=Rhizophora mucronata TaxID=61149 RepID=A0A2P2NEM6_RHIMU